MGNSAYQQVYVWALFASCVMLLPTAKASADIRELHAQLHLPDERIGYAEAKILVDSMIDPGIDTSNVLRELDAWERAVRSNIPPHPTSRRILAALLQTLYEPGPWNQERPFSYDLSDPLGRNQKNKQLAVYLESRKGNCVSMPILFVILGQRLGLGVALATAPHHVLVKFTDDTGQTWLNVEATAGGFKADSSYVRETGISESAILGGTYLRPLTPREGVGVIAGSLMEHYAKNRRADELMVVADMVLSVNPRDPVATVWKANAYYLQLQERYVRRYPSPGDIPEGQLADYHRLSRENFAWFAKAEALGWRPETSDQEATYLEKIIEQTERKGD